jgi:hypothetical protein
MIHASRQTLEADVTIELRPPRRLVTLQRDGIEFVVSFYPEGIVVFRHTEPNALRKACTHLRWQIIADNSGKDVGLNYVSEQDHGDR